MTAADRIELENIVNELREMKLGRKEAKEKFDELQTDIDELTAKQQKYEDEIEGYDDDILATERALEELVVSLTDPDAEEQFEFLP